ncbi:dTDP-4-dehydrorhamnose 3,5-epimerase family protein [Mesorhizobium sp. CAU 1741]|uniref:dTDP-4-dehydrorhamnose 3,5-epimerase family protein n=1 Tax=Mesorhizobium sp. CAU 1741 TaxID=3140366 RepID=UPI00325B6C2E
MRFTKCRVAGAYVIDIEPRDDERGTFARTFCAKSFRDLGLDYDISQCNVSYSPTRGTLRGLHYQAAPDEETKLVRVTRGKAFDVAVDLRPDSPTYLGWDGIELDSDRRNAFYIPSGCAHGVLTLEDATEIFYQMSAPYAPESASVARWDDPAFGIAWPFNPIVISDRDATCPFYRSKDP